MNEVSDARHERGVQHVPVMVAEVLQLLRAAEGGVFLDCTFGGGGHTQAILDAHPNAWVVAFDRDARAIERGQRWAQRYGERLKLQHAPFSQVATLVGAQRFDGILADLGMSTDQLREGRGFSFADAAALDMRMDEGAGESAAEFISTSSERDIYLALARGGVGAEARALARALVRARPFESAQQLAEVVRQSQLGKRSASKVHPATVVFQALRMQVNGELDEIEKLLQAAPDLVRPAGRLVVLTFHSIEDRVVTNRMRGWESSGSYPSSWRGPRTERSRGQVVVRKAVVPSTEEVAVNPAARSARLRAFQFSGSYVRL
jgi:16S rRNA (cytosine1402-N4)-methyltransferase